MEAPKQFDTSSHLDSYFKRVDEVGSWKLYGWNSTGLTALETRVLTVLY